MVILEKQTFKAVAPGEPPWKLDARKTFSGGQTVAEPHFLLSINPSSLSFRFPLSRPAVRTLFYGSSGNVVGLWEWGVGEGLYPKSGTIFRKVEWSLPETITAESEKESALRRKRILSCKT